mmetsp:Transcript_32447/g.78537  ORF Transcript_32447/g.78537 Transcript_32447/m.78537 type:complete len:217 (+) Transcript_32447:1471-2121(+)
MVDRAIRPSSLYGRRPLREGPSAAASSADIFAARRWLGATIEKIAIPASSSRRRRRTTISAAAKTTAALSRREGRHRPRRDALGGGQDLTTGRGGATRRIDRRFSSAVVRDDVSRRQGDRALQGMWRAGLQRSDGMPPADHGGIIEVEDDDAGNGRRRRLRTLDAGGHLSKRGLRRPLRGTATHAGHVRAQHRALLYGVRRDIREAAKEGSGHNKC